MLLTEPYYLSLFYLFTGAVLGSVFYRSDFCMAGMFRDVFLFRNYSLLRSLLLLIVVAMLLFHLARLSGFVMLYPPPVYSPPSAATFIGGMVFGVGMVLAGGCVVGTLYKMAGGNLANLIAFAGMIAGSMVYAEFHAFWEAFRSKTVLLPSVLLSEMTPKGETMIAAFVAAVSFMVFWRWKREGKWTLTAYADGYLQPWKAAVIIAVLNAAVYVLSGWPMGVTTAYAKIGAYAENLFMPAHVSELVYFNTDSLTVAVPGAEISGGAGPKVDIISITELPLVIGIIAGSFLTALKLKEFRIYGLPPRRQIASSFVGGVLLALGARIAGGCNLKFVLGALPLFAFQGIVFVAALIIGSYFGAKILKRLVIT